MSTMVDIDIKTILMQELLLQRKTGQFCDMQLALGHKVIHAHASLLCAISPYIKTRCVNALQISNTDNYKKFSPRSPVIINLYKKDSIDCFTCLEALMDIIYGSKTSIESIHSQHIYTMCKILSFSDLLMTIIYNNLQNGTADSKKCDKTANVAIQTDDFDEDFNFNFKKGSLDSLSLTSDLSDVDNHDIVKCKEKTISRTKKLSKNKKIHKLVGNLEMSNLKLLSGKMQSCIECQYKCYRPNDLLVHLRNTKHGNKVCSLCLTKMETVEELLDHYSIHDDPKPFICSFCDTRFQTRTLLIHHLPRHSKETPYVCNHCNKGFKWKHGLKSHLITHSNEKLHLCDECGFSTTHSKTLKAHKLTHTGELFKCTFAGCTHTCSRKENMKIHLATHNNDKPFVCEICGNKFTQSKSLKRHALIHNSGGYHLCPHCPFKALRTDNLKSHIIRQHEDKNIKIKSEASIDSDNIEIKSLIKTAAEEDDLIVLANAASSRRKI